MRTIIHSLCAAVLGALYLATWTTVLLASISTPPTGSGPATIGAAERQPVRRVVYAPSQRRHLPAQKPRAHVLCVEPAVDRPALPLPRFGPTASTSDAVPHAPVVSPASSRAPPHA